MRHHTDAKHLATALRPLRLGTRLPRVGGLAIESRARAVGLDDHARARHAAWIGANALAACGRWVTSGPAPAIGAVWLPEPDAPRVLAVLAAAPALPVAESLPWSTRSVLVVLGVPTAPSAATCRTLVGAPAATVVAIARVHATATGYHVTFEARGQLACA
jgi:hypothetical protein